MEEIRNYKLKKFIKLDGETTLEYVRILNLINPNTTTNQLIHLSLRDVEFIKNHINSIDDKDLLEIISRVQGISNQDVLKMPIVKFFGIYNSIKEQLTRLMEAEENALASNNTDFKWEAVDGSAKMQKFGIYNVLDTISDGDILKWESIMELEYSEVFLKLLMNKTKRDIQTEMNNIKLNKVD